MNATVPQGWQCVKLGDVCQINPRRPKEFHRDDDDPTTFIPMGAVNAVAGKADKPQTRPYKEIKKGYTFFADGDVLFAKITPCMQNGKHFVADDLLDGVGFGSTEFHVLRPDDSLLARWMHLYLRQPLILKEATYHFTGTAGQQRVPDSFLKNLPIPLPPLADQKRIVAILNEQMAAVEKTRVAGLERVEAIRALSLAWLREVFSLGDGKLSHGQQWVKLADVSKIVGGTTPNTSVPDYWGGDVVWVTPADMGKLDDREIWTSKRKISHQGIESTKLRELPVGTLILSTRAPIGYVGIAKTPLCTNQGCKSFIPSDKIESEYLYFVLKYYVPEFEKLGSGSTYNEISKSKLENFEIPLPLLAEQKRIASALNSKIATAKKALTAAQAELDAITALPSALLRKAFSGTL